ncbi:MAG: ACT domain-containing protein [Coriobacteriia bacterium]|nr:ACT domain-containing protein [Coriobacteriia bacterium]
MRLDLRVLGEHLAVCRLPAGSPTPDWARSGALTAVTWTADATSVVCAASVVPEGTTAETGWRALQVAGPLDFALIGVLAALATPLAEAGVSIFAISTYDTDYVLVREEALEDATGALVAAGHRVERTDRR